MRALLLVLPLWLVGCQSLGYYPHLAGGHLALMRARVPLEQARLEQPPAVAAALAEVAAIRQFAAIEMGLPVGDAYRHYVPLQRPWVVWNLVAAPADQLAPVQWCYPLIGCASYRGFFDPARAERSAARWQAQGLEVYGGGAIAYSTLGWFDDPVTAPMLAGNSWDRAELLFHELTHRRLYLPGDTAFNESLATAVGREGARRFSARQGVGVAPRPGAEAARTQVLEWVAHARQTLQALYQSQPDAEALEAGKRAVQQQLRQRYAEALPQQPALTAWQRWFAGPLNNAQLASLQDYTQWVPAFDRLLLQCGGRWSCFWTGVDQLATLSPAARSAALSRLTDPESTDD